MSNNNTNQKINKNSNKQNSSTKSKKLVTTTNKSNAKNQTIKTNANIDENKKIQVENISKSINIENNLSENEENKNNSQNTTLKNQNNQIQLTSAEEKYINSKKYNFSIIKKENGKYAKFIILFVLFMMQAIGYGVAQNIQPLFVFPVSAVIFNDSFTLFLLVFTISAIVSSIAQPIIAKIYGRVNTKLIFTIGSIVSGLCMILSGLTYFMYKAGVPEGGYATYLYIVQIFVQIGCLLFSGLGIPFIVGSWFPGKNRGTALGVCMSGGSVGNFMWQPVVSEALNSPYLKIDGVEGTQWVSSYFIFGGISIIFMLIMTILFIKNPPIVQSPQTNNKNVLQTSIEKSGPGIRYVMRLPLFWILFIGYSFFAFGICSFTTQYGSYLQKGLDWFHNQSLYYLIGITGTFYAVGCLLGNFFGGVIFSKTNTFTGFAIAGIFRIIGLILFFAAILVPWFAPLGAAVVGFSCYTYTSGPAFMSMALFGRKDNLRIMGIIGIGFAIGFAISNPVYGALIGDIKIPSQIFGQTVYGNYQNLLLVGGITLGIGVVVMLFAIFYIQKMGLLGIYNYSNSKYSNIIRMYSLKIWVESTLIWLFKDDYRVNPKYINKYNKKVAKHQSQSTKHLSDNTKWFNHKIEKIHKWYDEKLNIINNQIKTIDEQNAKQPNDKKLIVQKKKLDKKLVNLNQLNEFKLNNLKIAYSSLNDYYSNKYNHIEKIISQRVFDKYNKNVIHATDKLNLEFTTINKLEEKILKINNQWKENTTKCDFFEDYDSKIQQTKSLVSQTVSKSNI